jgi:hypothetical protein
MSSGLLSMAFWSWGISVLLDLRLKVEIGRGKNLSMTDWIREAAASVRTRSRQDDDVEQRRLLDAAAIKRDMPRLFRELGEEVKAAVDEFNSYFVGSTSPDPVLFGVPHQNEFTVRSQYARPGGEFHMISVQLVKEQEEIICHCANLGLIPGHLYFKVNRPGDTYLADEHEKRPLTTPQTAEMILGPLFSQLSLPHL